MTEALSQLINSADFHTLSKRSKGEWLGVHEKTGSLYPITSWFGKALFSLCNSAYKGRDLVRVKEKIQQMMAELEIGVQQLDSSLSNPLKTEEELAQFEARNAQFFSAQSSIRALVNGAAYRISPKILNRAQLERITLLAAGKCNTYCSALLQQLSSEEAQLYDFTLHPPETNKLNSRRLELYQAASAKIAGCGKKSPNVASFCSATTQKVDFAAKKILAEISRFSALIDTTVPLYAFPDKIESAKADVSKLLSKLKPVSPNFYNRKVLEQLQEAFHEPEITEAKLALQAGKNPTQVSEGVSGTYIVKNRLGKPCGIFKPACQEIGQNKNPKSLKKWDPATQVGVASGKGYVREAAAFALDHDRHANVPLTKIVRFAHQLFGCDTGSKQAVGSFQVFKASCRHMYDLCSASGKTWTEYVYKYFFRDIKKVSVDRVHALAILDIRLLNADRHMNNALVDAEYIIHPIDHGFVLPTQVKRLRFGWTEFSQSKKQFSKESLEYIEKIDIKRDAQILRELQIEQSAIQRMEVATALLKRAAKSGFTPYEIADLMLGRDKHACRFESTICRKILHEGHVPEEVLKAELSQYRQKHPLQEGFSGLLSSIF